ncbi:GGDEF domain-containing protein [Roseibium sp. CAU 1637]|uniref:diguanylate cyclase n=1 Tax=Roseibium limicola TaxID=2816037 RepID=A0A939EPM2_9HYPH|nr:GGDEF domain-containing protein [Roseibium limicola]MBO0345752.1 GGDEF domain-containing protein [Roseibium limicola]
MFLYQSLDKVFPRSYTAKVFCVAFIGTHVPLICMVMVVLFRHGGIWGQIDVLAPLLLATLAGTFATLWSLKAILVPIYKVQSTMESFAADHTAEPLPDIHSDEVGSLMKSVNSHFSLVTSELSEAMEAAHTDPLTGLLNRRGFEARTSEQCMGSILLIDIDNFKSINDNFGHDAGDDVLIEVSRVLTESVRTSDVVGRYGGEEFIVFLPNSEHRSSSVIAERIRRSVAQKVHIGPRLVTVSVGVAIGSRSKTIPDLIPKADDAIYRAKREGRNRVVISGFAVV